MQYDLFAGYFFAWLFLLCDNSQQTVFSGLSRFSDTSLRIKLQHFSSKTVDAECIVTRNKKDFNTSEIPVYELDEFMTLLDNDK